MSTARRQGIPHRYAWWRCAAGSVAFGERVSIAAGAVIAARCIVGILECRPSHQVVPRALLADLDDIGNVDAGPFRQACQLAPQRDTAAMPRQAGPEHVGDVNQPGGVADGALAGDWASDLASCPNELGVGVADLGPRKHTIAKVGQHRRARQSVVDMALGVPGARWWYTKHRPSIVGPTPCVVHHRSVTGATPGP